MALKNGLETGLETNIYDLLIGDETSFKDAILKSARTAAKTAAKELAVISDDFFKLRMLLPSIEISPWLTS